MNGRLAVFVCVFLGIPVLGSAQPCTQAPLNTEFLTDPTGRVYTTCATDGNLSGVNVNDVCVLDKFNAVCTDAACKVDNVLTREVIIETIINSVELETLARSAVANDVARRQQLSWLLQANSYNMAKASSQQKWKNVFSSADSPVTNAAINTAQLKNASRAQVVCHRVGTIDDVSCGLRGTACP
jgi:hypothetical protein